MSRVTKEMVDRACDAFESFGQGDAWEKGIRAALEAVIDAESESILVELESLPTEMAYDRAGAPILIVSSDHLGRAIAALRSSQPKPFALTYEEAMAKSDIHFECSASEAMAMGRTLAKALNRLLGPDWNRGSP